MFSGIIEAFGKIVDVREEATNKHFSLSCPFTHELKIDQSVAHNGVCLTVTEIHDQVFSVTAIAETLSKTTLGAWKKGDIVNLERCLQVGDRLDGHIVQGHVDQTAQCIEREDQNGSWKFGFQFEQNPENITVPRGSITVNGVSLTVVDSESGYFSVAIIPYTFEHTNFQWLKAGDSVNLEFDVFGKYVARYYHAFQKISAR